MERIKKLPRRIFNNIFDILLWVVLGVLGILGYKFSRDRRREIRDLERKLEEKQLEGEEIEEQIKKLFENVKDREREIKKLANLISSKLDENEELRDLLEKEKEKTDDILGEDIDDKESYISDSDTAYKFIRDILDN